MTTEQAEAIATEAINGYFNEVPEPHDDVDDYSCNECGFDVYLCPHLYERLKKHFVNALLNL